MYFCAGGGYYYYLTLMVSLLPTPIFLKKNQSFSSKHVELLRVMTQWWQGGLGLGIQVHSWEKQGIATAFKKREGGLV